MREEVRDKERLVHITKSDPTNYGKPFRLISLN